MQFIFQTERIHCSAVSDQVKPFQILDPILKYIVLIFFIISRICLLNYVTL